ncbi:unnamed protein product [Blepharisma stoltei]|uniref:Vacuolar fusion protein MON1 homolog n=1 Tax=Blepharisma stoltei TaxID=1481888 RepID=A0AAU9IE63_9CILI|nr:unnamed protein product [Blepharisma stoltei]
MDPHAKSFQKKKLFYVLTSAGKPVWTRYGECADLAVFIGALAAIIFKFQSYYNGVKDSLRYLRTSDTYIVILCTEALYYVCISRGKDSIESIYHQLEMLHAKVLSTLTSSITQTLLSRPGFDVGNLMGGTHDALDTLIRTSAISPCFLEGFMPVRMPISQRSQISQAFKNSNHEDILYGFLMTPEFMIYKYCRRGEQIHPIDIFLLTNLLTSYASLRSTMSWTPICLPNYNNEGFVYAYITFIQDTKIGIILISDNASAFKDLKFCADGIEKEIVSLIPVLMDAIRMMPYSITTCEAADFKHFLYMPKGDQYSMPSFYPSTRTILAEIPIECYKKTLRRYYSAFKLSKCAEYFKGYYVRIDIYRNEQIVCIRQPEYTLLGSISPLISSASVVQSVNQLLRWLKSEEQNLFIK